MKMSDLTHQMLSTIDYNSIKKIREENYTYLHKHLGDINKLNLCLPEGPYAYPLLCENGIEIRKKLADKKIYIATLWPNVLKLDSIIEKEYAQNILPLPCDQRYGQDEMQFMIEELKKYI